MASFYPEKSSSSVAMNRIDGTIVDIDTDGYMSLVKVKTEIGYISLILLETPSKADYLRKGRLLNLIFNPTSVKISKVYTEELSIDNSIECQVKDIKYNKILSVITLKAKDIEIISYITTKTKERLNIKQGEKVYALISSSDIMVEV